LVAVWYHVGAARVASRESKGRAWLFDKRAMTDKLRRHQVLLLAAALALTACRKPSATVTQAAPPAQKSATLGAVAKPLDAAPAEARPQPQPAPAPCIATSGGRDPALPDLLEQASRDFEQGRYEDALECAREASRTDGTSVAAHHFRGAALAELGHIEEARTAYARALAIDPDDAEVL